MDAEHQRRIDQYAKMIDHGGPAHVYARLSEAYRKLGQLEAAKATAIKGLQAHPGALSVQEMLGLALMDMGETDGAARALAPVVEKLPDNAVAAIGLSVCLARMDKLEESLKVLRRRLERDPMDQQARALIRKLEDEGVSAVSMDDEPEVASEGEYESADDEAAAELSSETEPDAAAASDDVATVDAEFETDEPTKPAPVEEPPAEADPAEPEPEPEAKAAPPERAKSRRSKTPPRSPLPRGLNNNAAPGSTLSGALRAEAASHEPTDESSETPKSTTDFARQLGRDAHDYMDDMVEKSAPTHDPDLGVPSPRPEPDSVLITERGTALSDLLNDEKAESNDPALDFVVNDFHAIDMDDGDDTDLDLDAVFSNGSAGASSARPPSSLAMQADEMAKTGEGQVHVGSRPRMGVDEDSTTTILRKDIEALQAAAQQAAKRRSFRVTADDRTSPSGPSTTVIETREEAAAREAAEAAAREAVAAAEPAVEAQIEPTPPAEPERVPAPKPALEEIPDTQVYRISDTLDADVDRIVLPTDEAEPELEEPVVAEATSGDTLDADVDRIVLPTDESEPEVEGQEVGVQLSEPAPEATADDTPDADVDRIVLPTDESGSKVDEPASDVAQLLSDDDANTAIESFFTDDAHEAATPDTMLADISPLRRFLRRVFGAGDKSDARRGN
ncbi:MAG: tetratricopeptide repeat protein [Deltaproteobacteria bacterium]|nr:tetratricopeptide repeat protein [Deltaproteobacteria bacterium]